MSRNKSAGGGGDRKGEGTTGETVVPRMITSQTTLSGLPSLRPNPPSQPAGRTYIVHSQHEMKNMSKSARPIAPAPPTPMVQNLATLSLPPQSPQVNIPSIISPCPGSSDNIISLNLVTTTSASGLATVTHNPTAVPVSLSQASVLQLGSNTAGSSSSTIPVAMLRGSTNAGQQTQPQIQTFTQHFSHLSRGTSNLAVPKAAGLLRQSCSSVLQNSAGINTLSLPLVRTPLSQAIKTATAPVTRPQPSTVVHQAQSQELSRTNFSMHGSITPVTSGSLSPLPLHVTLNRLNTPSSLEDTSIQGRTIPTYVQSGAPVIAQQRISGSASSDSSMHPRLIPDLGRLALPFSRSTILSHPSLTPTAKVISAQPGTPIKPAKVMPQRQLPVGSISSTPSPSLQPYSTPSASSLSAASTPLSVSVPNTSLPVFSMPSSSSISTSLPVNIVEAGSIRHEQMSMLSTQSSSSNILIASDFQSRPPGSIITMTTPTSSVQGGTVPLMVSQAENRSNSQSQQQFDVKPGDSMWLQHYVFHAQTPMVSQPPQIVRPGTNTLTFLPSQVQAQNTSLAANQLAAMSVASSSNIRFNAAPVLMMDQLRQQQHPLHSTYSTATTTVSGPSDKTAANLLSRAVAASSIYTSSVGIQSHTSGGGGTGSTNAARESPSAVPVTNANSSPRPSILRKRPSEASGIAVRKPNFNLNQENNRLSPPRVDTNAANICSPKMSIKHFSPVSENSQSSTDTALSSNDVTTPTHNHNDRRKANGEDCLENGPVTALPSMNNIPPSPAVNHIDILLEASPRKRARKQLLHVSEELKDNNMSSSEGELENSTHHDREDSSLNIHKYKEREIRGEYTDDDGVRWILSKPKPTFVLLQPDVINNKTRNNHFTRYSDVRSKEEKWPTVNELSNQRGIMQKVNGWKLYFSASQLEELMDVEKDMQQQFCDIQAALTQLPTHKVNNEETLKIHEMSQANIQRCQLIQSQLTDARAAMIRTLEHKPRIQEIVTKHQSKRPIKKKERT